MKTKQTQGQTALSRIIWFIMAAAAVFGLLLGSNARAAGLLIEDGGFGGVLEIQEHDVHVLINNGVAVTRIDQVSGNTENRQVEALYLFPGDSFVVASCTDHYGQASLATDVVVTSQLQRAQTGLDLITSRQSGADGFFSLSLTAGQELAQMDGGMDCRALYRCLDSAADGGL